MNIFLANATRVRNAGTMDKSTANNGSFGPFLSLLVLATGGGISLPFPLPLPLPAAVVNVVTINVGSWLVSKS